ncbi:hypothetical protein [Erysipelothrix anatis]|uniref:hypothetical protein n=1 Tax=Erysipelothrix anatis TaxID=2683713 RepID=UPI00135C174A|nr:hypothetical protein [Erysipelothrix anatis]
MTQTGFELILASIQKSADASFQETVEQAHKAGQKLYDQMIQEGNERQSIRLKKIEVEAKQLEKRTFRNIEKHEHERVENLKHELVSRIYDDVIATFEALSPEQTMLLMNNALSKDETKKPRILICEAHYQVCLETFGQGYQVVCDSSIQNGFVLNYDNYDVNVEYKQYFEMNRELFTTKIYQILFGDHHEC